MCETAGTGKYTYCKSFSENPSDRPFQSPHLQIEVRLIYQAGSCRVNANFRENFRE